MTACHPQLLGWLLSHCPGLVEHEQVLTAAAKHCHLAGLHAVFGALSVNVAGQGWILDAAAESPTPDAVAKMEWLMAVGGGRFRLQGRTAAAAARSGDLGRLQWLRQRGCPMGSWGVLEEALQHADLAVAQWLVDEAGCELPPAVGTDDEGMVEGEHHVWDSLLEAAARGSDGLAKVGWLQQRWGGQLQARHWQRMAVAAAEEGRVEMVQHALSVLGPAVAMPEGLAHTAVRSGSVLMVQTLRHAGVAFDHWAYIKAAEAGSLAMVRWLACDAGVSAEGLDLHIVVERWPHGPTAATSRELLQAVQLLMETAGGQAGRIRTVLIQAAAKRGNLPLVQYLLQRRPRYRPNFRVGLAAAQCGCEALLEWLVEQHPGCLAVPPGRCSPYVFPAVAGDLGTLTALRRMGVPWGAEDMAAVVWPKPGLAPAALHWLVEQGAPGDWPEVRVLAGSPGDIGGGIPAGLQSLGPTVTAAKEA